jgi:hypothetical protein
VTRNPRPDRAGAVPCQRAWSLRRRVGAIGLALSLVAASSCAGGRSSLGTAASSCFRALPPAKDAVHGKGRLLGVRRVSVATLKQRLPSDTKLAALPNQEVCVFAFQGPFAAGQVTGAVAGATGQYAVIAVTSKRPEVVRAIVTNRLPTRFAHLH